MVPRTPEQNKAIRQQAMKEIKDVAFELFAKHGFTETPISAIAEKAGISKGLIYHYFDSKEAILKAIFDELVKVGNQIVNFPEESLPPERMHIMLDMLFDFIKEYSEINRFMISLALQPDAVAVLKPSFDEFNELQIRILSNLLSELGYKDAENEAFYLAAKLDGIAIGYLTLKDEYPFEAVKQKILDEYVF